MYCTLQDMRDRGISATDHNDAAVTAAIVRATNFVDQTTRQFFEERSFTARLLGRGLAELYLPLPPIVITTVTVEGVELGSDNYELIMPELCDEQDSRMNPFLLYTDDTWTEDDVVLIESSWGYVDDPAGAKSVPERIVEACILKTMLGLGVDPDTFGGLVSERIGNYGWQRLENVVRENSTPAKILDALKPYIKPIGGLW